MLKKNTCYVSPREYLGNPQNFSIFLQWYTCISNQEINFYQTFCTHLLIAFSSKFGNKHIEKKGLDQQIQNIWQGIPKTTK